MFRKRVHSEGMLPGPDGKMEKMGGNDMNLEKYLASNYELADVRRSSSRATAPVAILRSPSGETEVQTVYLPLLDDEECERAEQILRDGGDS